MGADRSSRPRRACSPTVRAARRRFAAYWRVIYPGSAIIRRMWLRAIERRAMAVPTRDATRGDTVKLVMKALIRLTVLATAAATLTAQSRPGDWPQWRGPNRDGVIASFTEPTSWPERLTRKWKVDVGLGYATPDARRQPRLHVLASGRQRGARGDRRGHRCQGLGVQPTPRRSRSARRRRATRRDRNRRRPSPAASSSRWG